MVDYSKVKKASLEELLDDERKIVLMNKLTGRTLDYPDRYQRFFCKYVDAYNEYIEQDDKNMMKILLLCAKHKEDIDDDEYTSILEMVEKW